jgi:hypothetical protein
MFKSSTVFRGASRVEGERIEDRSQHRPRRSAAWRGVVGKDPAPALRLAREAEDTPGRHGRYLADEPPPPASLTPKPEGTDDVLTLVTDERGGMVSRRRSSLWP